MKCSHLIEALLKEHREQPLSLGSLLCLPQEQGFGLLGSVLVAPMLVPIPIPLPGFSTIFGVGLILLGGQLLLGYRQPWLPPKLASYTLAPATAAGLLRGLLRVLKSVEWICRSRWTGLCHAQGARRILGLCLVWNAFLMGLPLPIPFTNFLPAYAILFLMLGLLEADGVALLLGYGLTGATTAYFAGLATVIGRLVCQILGC